MSISKGELNEKLKYELIYRGPLAFVLTMP